MSKFFKKLFCFHYWNLADLPIVDVVYGKGFLKEYTCVKCGKKIHRFNDPINYIRED